MDLEVFGRALRNVADDLRRNVQADGRSISYGIPDPLAHDGGRGQAQELQRLNFGDRSIARLRIGERLQHRL